MEPGVSTPPGRSSVSVPLSGRVPSVTKVHNQTQTFFTHQLLEKKKIMIEIINFFLINMVLLILQTRMSA